MVNAIEPFSYIHPHKHENPDKREVFIILRGRLAAIFFNEKGEVSEHFILDNKGKNYGVEIPPRTWHTFISLESGTVVYELKDGPYFPLNDKNFAPWAPRENDPKCRDYIKKLCEELSII